MADPCKHRPKGFGNKDTGQIAPGKDGADRLGRGKGNQRILPVRLKEGDVNHEVDRPRGPQ